MAAVYGQKYFWNITFEQDYRVLKSILKESFTTLTLVVGIILVILGPVSMTANGIVVAAIWKDPFKQLRSSPSNFIIASMAGCDFLIGFFSIFAQGFWFISMSVNSPLATRIAPVAFALGELLVAVTILHTIALTTDRVLAVSNPLLYKSRVTRTRVLFSIFLIWVIGVAFVTLKIPLYNRYYMLSIISMAFFDIIGTPVAVLCIMIIYFVRKQTNRLKRNNEMNSNEKHIHERDRKNYEIHFNHSRILLGMF